MMMPTGLRLNTAGRSSCSKCRPATVDSSAAQKECNLQSYNTNVLAKRNRLAISYSTEPGAQQQAVTLNTTRKTNVDVQPPPPPPTPAKHHKPPLKPAAAAAAGNQLSCSRHSQLLLLLLLTASRSQHACVVAVAAWARVIHKVVRGAPDLATVLAQHALLAAGILCWQPVTLTGQQ